MPNGLGTMGKYLIGVGAVIAFVGLLMIVLGRFPGLKIGRLPGDIYVEREGWRFYFPLMTSIILSLIVSLLLWLFSRKQ
jgi:hypothetical protein